jgi:predicted DsbA family dithiol-disulfide isomerase
MLIDLYQDLVCPWCRIGKRNLDLALREWTGSPVTVRYQPFLLDDSVPVENPPAFHDYMARRKGSRDLAPMFAHVSQAGAAVGLTFNFDRISVATNTLLGHRLMALTPPAMQGMMLDALHQAYFEDGRDIGDRDTLVAIAATVGLNRTTTAAQLAGDTKRDEVLSAVAEVRQLGITGVPFFVFDRAISASGAQPAAVLRRGMHLAEEQALAVR